jgi:hypothetical protein
MNEKIKELIAQATTEEHGVIQPRQISTVYHFDKEKFAELIVRECIQVCKNRVANHDYNTGRMHCVSDIKDHFGLK